MSLRSGVRWGIFVTVVLCTSVRVPAQPAGIDWERAGDEALDKLRAYVRLDTTNPPGNETPAAELLRGWLAGEGIEARLYDAMGNPARQALVARVPGTSGRTIVLMSHSDVVPAVAAEWSHPPFAAALSDGVVYGRGTLDTKDLGVFQLMTLLLMHRQGMRPRDDLLLVVEPDEEANGDGIRGMLERFPGVFHNVRFVLNEGGYGLRGMTASGKPVLFVQTAEKGVAWMKVTARGTAGHGSVPRPDNAVAAMARALSRIAAYQTPLRPAPGVVAMFHTLADQESFPTSFVMRHVDNPLVLRLFGGALTAQPLVNALLRTTISPTSVRGGYKTNVIPAEVEATLDCRVTVGDSAAALRDELQHAVDDPHVTITVTHDGTPNASPVDPVLMGAIGAAAARHLPGSVLAPLMSSGVTDSAPFRRRNIAAYGFVPVVLTQVELDGVHGVDERIRVEEIRRGLQMYYEVVAALAGTAG